MNLENLPLSEKTKKNLHQIGYYQLTDIQLKTIAPVLEGRDVIAQSQTGYREQLGALWSATRWSTAGTRVTSSRWLWRSPLSRTRMWSRVSSSMAPDLSSSNGLLAAIEALRDIKDDWRRPCSVVLQPF